jgi:predicted transglutaminase-like cysteine proteinase
LAFDITHHITALTFRRSAALVFAFLLSLFLFWLSSTVHGAANFERLLVSISERYGPSSIPRYRAWRALLTTMTLAQDTERLRRVNEFFNRQIQFADDSVVWGQTDYWASPIETLGKGAGDCEDFAIAKYFTLKEVGIESDKLRLIYVRVRSGAAENVPSQAHMVLAYYAQPEAEPLLMDNLISDIRPASKRPDLVPVFSFNSEGVFTGVSAKESGPAAGVGRLSRWEDLLRKAKAEGFE